MQGVIPLRVCFLKSFIPDNCTNFSSAKIFPDGGIRKVSTSSYHPKGNGRVQRVDNTLAQMLTLVACGSK